MDSYAKIVVKGSPISKSNFKLVNSNGRSILPVSSGKYHDRYAIYEETIAFEARAQNPSIVLEDGLIAVLNVYYKSELRHPDTNNIPKSIFDGIEKSGLIINDSQIKTLVINEFYDKENPRFELELFAESSYDISYSINKKETPSEKTIYSPIKNSKTLKTLDKKKSEKKDSPKASKEKLQCEICNKSLKESEYLKGNGGKTLICRACFSNLF